MSDKDHNGDMVNLLGPKKARKVKEKVDTTKTLFVRNDRWVLVTSVVILFLSFLLVSLSGYVTNLRQEDVKQAMYTYEQQIFEKKIQIYREEYRVKGVQVTELENRIEIISKELQEAYNQVSFANMQLEKASRMLGEENVRIKQLDHANKGLEGQLAKKLSTLETLKSELKDETKENTGFTEELKQVREEKRLLEKDMRGKNAQVSHLLKRIEELKADKNDQAASYKALKAKLTELEVKEKLESEEIALLKEAIGKGVDISDDTSLEEELEAIKKLLEDDEDELQSSESSSQTSGDSANATTEGGDDDDDDEW